MGWRKGGRGMKTYQNAPDWRNLARAARNEWVPHVPLYEHIIGAKVIYEITGNRPYDGMFSPDMAQSRESFQQYWDFWRCMGYDTASMEFAFTGILPGAGALGSFGRCYSVLGRGRALILWRLTPRVDRLWSMAEVAGGSSPRTPRAMRHPLKPRTNR